MDNPAEQVLMPRLGIGMSNERGFTLIEILVIVLIIGITAGMAILAFGDFGASRKVTMAAEQFSTYLQLLQQKAILETNTLGVKFEKNTYLTYQLKEGKNWEQFTQNTLFHPRFFPQNAVLAIQSNKVLGNPDIIIYSSGDLSPFVLTMGTVSQPNLIRLQGNSSGELILNNETKTK